MLARIVKRLNIPVHARVERVVCRFDGLADAVDPNELFQVCRSLWTQVGARLVFKPDFLFGLDSGGIIPTLGLAAVSGIPYRIAYKVDLDLSTKLTICEPFAARPSIFAYNIAKGEKAVLVDDEVFSGETMCNAITVLRSAGVDVLAIVCLIEITSAGARRKIEGLGVPLFSAATLAINS